MREKFLYEIGFYFLFFLPKCRKETLLKVLACTCTAWPLSPGFSTSSCHHFTQERERETHWLRNPKNQNAKAAEPTPTTTSQQYYPCQTPRIRSPLPHPFFLFIRTTIILPPQRNPSLTRRNRRNRNTPRPKTRKIPPVFHRRRNRMHPLHPVAQPPNLTSPRTPSKPSRPPSPLRRRRKLRRKSEDRQRR